MFPQTVHIILDIDLVMSPSFIFFHAFMSPPCRLRHDVTLIQLRLVWRTELQLHLINRHLRVRYVLSHSYIFRMIVANTLTCQ